MRHLKIVEVDHFHVTDTQDMVNFEQKRKLTRDVGHRCLYSIKMWNIHGGKVDEVREYLVKRRHIITGDDVA